VSSIATRRNLVIVLIDAGVWASWSALCGYVAHRIPRARLSRDRSLFRIRRFEAGGRFYERWLRIKRWKDRLPEAGALFRGGFSKRRVTTSDRAYLEGFAAETRRAELTHWLILAVSPWFFLWNPWWLGLAMVGYGIVANVPCLAIQRYNRARLLRMILRPSAARTA
jgi:glycosyl-4,4'-diaponeurosporenoate acyltransferase